MTRKPTLAAALSALGVLSAGWALATSGTPAPAALAPATADPPTLAPRTVATPVAAPTPATPAKTTGPATASAGFQDGSYTGSVASFRYGQVQVTVQIQGGQIVALSEKLASDGDRKSDAINARSLPTLKSAIKAANSAQVATISGATYTTRAYLTSLQAALDQA